MAVRQCTSIAYLALWFEGFFIFNLIGNLYDVLQFLWSLFHFACQEQASCRHCLKRLSWEKKNKKIMIKVVRMALTQGQRILSISRLTYRSYSFKERLE